MYQITLTFTGRAQTRAAAAAILANPNIDDLALAYVRVEPAEDDILLSPFPTLSAWRSGAPAAPAEPPPPPARRERKKKDAPVIDDKTLPLPLDETPPDEQPAAAVIDPADNPETGIELPPPPETDDPISAPVSDDDLRGAAAAVMKAGKRDAFRSLLVAFDVAQATRVPAERRAEFLAAMKAL